MMLHVDVGSGTKITEFLRLVLAQWMLRGLDSDMEPGRWVVVIDREVGGR